jgi:serralysin
MSNEGIDLVKTTLSSYTLAANVENLTFTDNAAHTGTGNALANALIGGAGSDTLVGGAGVDRLTGGAGADLFRFNEGDTSVAPGQHDLITDFTIGKDVIDLTGIDANTLTPGMDTYFRFMGIGTFDGFPAALHYNYDDARGVTVVEGDVNGDKVADFAIDLTGHLQLTPLCFVI